MIDNNAGKNTELAVIGFNHNSSAVAEREIFQPNRKDLPELLKTIFSFEEIDGILILSTCNRLEFYMDIQKGFEPYEILKRIFKDRNSDFNKYAHIFYKYYDIDATKHLFRVISGIDSLVPGEYQIQGQVKEAYSIACEAKTVNKLLHKLFHAAFRTGKKVRTNTSLGEGRRSVSGIAAQILIDNLATSDTICIIGVNENTKIMAEKLSAGGFNNFIFANRTKYKAEILAEEFNSKASGLNELEQSLELSKAVYTSTGATDFIITKEMLSRLDDKNCCPELFVDMALPRDVEASVLPDNIKVFNIDDLHKYLDLQIKTVLESIPDAEKIIEDETSVFQAWAEMQTNNILEPYSEKFEIIRQQLMEEFKDQFSAQSFEKADKLSRSLVHRMQSTFVRAIIRTNQELKVFLQHRDSM